MKRDDLCILDLSQRPIKTLLKRNIDSAEGLHIVEIRKLKDQRTLSQNAFFHGVVCKHIGAALAEHWGGTWTLQTTKAFLKQRFLMNQIVNESTGEVVAEVVGETSALDIDQMVRFIDQCIEFGVDQLGIDPMKFETGRPRVEEA